MPAHDSRKLYGYGADGEGERKSVGEIETAQWQRPSTCGATGRVWHSTGTLGVRQPPQGIVRRLIQQFGRYGPV